MHPSVSNEIQVAFYFHIQIVIQASSVANSRTPWEGEKTHNIPSWSITIAYFPQIEKGKQNAELEE